jgi:haloalkane dehalogenase
MIDSKFTSKFTEVNSHKVHYLEKGTGNIMLFIHGLPTSSYLWRNIIPILSEKTRCIALDLIGMGESDKPNSQYSVMGQLQDITDFIKKLKLTNITLVLHGFGSIIGFNYAMNNPNNIAGIAFYEPHLHILSDLNNLSLPLQELIHLFRQEPDYGYKKIVEDNFLIEKLLPGMAFNKLSPEANTYYRKPFINLEDRKALWHQFKELFSSDCSDSKLDACIARYSEFLQKSSIPKLLLYNNPGFITSMSSVEWCHNLPNTKSVDLEEGLNLAQETNPHLFAAMLLDWYNHYVCHQETTTNTYFGNTF